MRFILERMRNKLQKMIGVVLSAVMCTVVVPFTGTEHRVSAESTMESEWKSMSIGGGGFVTGIVTGESAIYARTDVGGAYRYDDGKWTQLMNFIVQE